MNAAKQGRPLPVPEITTPIDPEFARRIAGRYGNGPKFVDLIESAGKLSKLASDGGEQVRLRTLGSSLIVDDKLAYGEKLVVREGEVVIGGETFKRVEVSKPPPAPAGWRGLIGEYGWDHDILYIFEKDGKLWALIRFEFNPIELVSENVFKFPNRGLYDGERLTFTRDKNGRATSVEAASVVKLSNSKPGWMLAGDLVMRMNNTFVIWAIVIAVIGAAIVWALWSRAGRSTTSPPARRSCRTTA
jgi:hypothetical protein